MADAGGATIVRPVPFDGGSLGGVSLESLNLDFQDFAPGGRFYHGKVEVAPQDTKDLTVAHDPNLSPSTQRFTGNPSQGYSLYNSRPPSEWPRGKTFQNWQWPVRVPPGMPILEVVTNRIARSMISQKYYLTDGVCGPAIDILSEFPLNRGFEITVEYLSDVFPLWFDASEISPDSLIDAEGNSRVRIIVSEYVKKQCEQLADDLNLVYQMVDLQKEAYIHGDAFINRVDDINNTNYTWDHTREYTENTIVELQGLNPTAIWIIRNDVGETERIVGVRQAGADAYDLDLNHMIHLKHKGSAYTTYGFPQTLRVIKELQVKEAYLNAAQAWGERYSLPIRLLKYGVLVRAGENSGPVATPSMRAAAEEAIKNYDPASGHTIVAPFHWDYQFVGAEGTGAMTISDELMEANRRILAGLGVPSAFLMGDWTNYSTARIQYNGLMHRLKTVQEHLKRILERRIFGPFMIMRGYVDALGQPMRVRISWKRGHLEDDQSMQDFMAEIAQIPGVLSLQTIRETMGFDSITEESRLDAEADRVARRQLALRTAFPLEQFPSQSPVSAPAGVPDQQMPDPTSMSPVVPGTPAYDQELKQQIIVRRLQQGLQRIQDKLLTETSAAQASLSALLRDPAREQRMVAVQVVEAHRRLKNLSVIKAGYEFHLQARTAIRPVTALLAPKPTGMVALFVPPELHPIIAVPGGELPDDLHCTLAVFDQSVDPNLLYDALLAVAETKLPLEGTINGSGRFHGVSAGQDAIISLLDIPDLASFRQMIVDVLASCGVPVLTNHGFTPHITRIYVDPMYEPIVTPIPPTPVRFTSMSLVVGDVRVDMPLGGVV